MTVKNWPMHSNGRPKMFAELSDAERRNAPVFRRLFREITIAPALTGLIECGGAGYPLWCVVRTAILCAIVALVSWAIGLSYVWPGVLATALCGVWSAANDAVNPLKQ